MRHPIVPISLAIVMLAVGCGGGGVEDDLKKSGDELRKEAAKMSDADLQRKMDELEKYTKEMQAKSGDGEPSKGDIEKGAKLMEVIGIYGAELMKRRMK